VKAGAWHPITRNLDEQKCGRCVGPGTTLTCGANTARACYYIHGFQFFEVFTFRFGRGAGPRPASGDNAGNAGSVRQKQRGSNQKTVFGAFPSTTTSGVEIRFVFGTVGYFFVQPKKAPGRARQTQDFLKALVAGQAGGSKGPTGPPR